MKMENSGLQQDGSENDVDAAILLMDVMMDTTKDGTCEDKDSRSNPAASLVKGILFEVYKLSAHVILQEKVPQDLLILLQSVLLPNLEFY